MIQRYRQDAGELIPDADGEWMKHVDYLADEGNWVPLEDYNVLMNQLVELLESLRKK